MLCITYLGTRYFGWQKTKNHPTIQQALETACARIFQEPVACEAASRTDRGVHAKGQMVQFQTTKSFAPERLSRALNAGLPSDIRVQEVTVTEPDFHVTLDAKAKTYHYSICSGSVQHPFDRHTSWHYPYPIDRQKIEDAALALAGTHDFSAFTTEPQESALRTVFGIDLTFLENDRLQISITADRFLYKMARRIVGTLAHVGSGKLSSQQIPLLFSSRDRKLAGPTAPAHGLTLYKVHYSEYNSAHAT